MSHYIGKQLKIELKKYCILDLVFIAIIIYVATYDISSFYGPLVGYDDIGYWSCARFFAFGSAKPIAGDLSFYAYGYGLLIAPLVYFIKDAIVLFRAIIIVNSMLCVASYIGLKRIGETMQILNNKFLISAFSFVSISYLSLYCYSKFIFTENLLTFLFVLLVNNILCLEKKMSIVRIINCYLISVIMYNVHQRSIAIIAALVISFVIYCLLMKDYKICIKHVIVGAFATIFFYAGSFLKSIVKANVYINQGSLDVNDIKANANKITLLFDIKNLFYAILSFLEKIFYLNFSTFLIGGIFICMCLYFLKVAVRNRENAKVLTFSFFILNSLMVFGVASIFAFGPLVNRFEFAVYGRYIEFIFPVYIFGGLNYLYKYRDKIDKILIIPVIFVFVGWCAIKYQFDSSGVEYSTSWLSPATHYFFAHYADLSKGMGLILKVIVLTCLLVLAYCKSIKKNFWLLLLIVGMIITWSVNGYNLEKRVKMSQNYMYKQIQHVCSEIKENGKDIYYYEIQNNRVGSMQYFCDSVDFYHITKDSLNELKDKVLIINAGDLGDVSDRLLKYEILYQDSDWILLRVN